MKFEWLDVGFGLLMTFIIAIVSGILFLAGWAAYSIWLATGPISPLAWGLIGAFVAVWVACTIGLAQDKKTVQHHRTGDLPEQL